MPMAERRPTRISSSRLACLGRDAGRGGTNGQRPNGVAAGASPSGASSTDVLTSAISLPGATRARADSRAAGGEYQGSARRAAPLGLLQAVEQHADAGNGLQRLAQQVAPGRLL